MTKSMTAFANSEMQIDSQTLSCEFRSVNHRYCDISIQLPEDFRFVEPQIRALISSRLKRGKIECCLSYKNQTDLSRNLTVDEEMVKSLLRATAQIEQHMHTQQSFSALEILNFPGVQKKTEINQKISQEIICGLVDDALGDLVNARTREGTQLALLIKERCHKALELVKLAQQRLPTVSHQLFTKIKKRLTELNIASDSERLEQEMVFLTQKMDVAEELDRLETHVQEVINILEKDEAVGRRLDFLMQEMNREANTLASKSADKQMTKISIELKVLIEQMREQIQNVE